MYDISMKLMDGNDTLGSSYNYSNAKKNVITERFLIDVFNESCAEFSTMVK
jgi:hypothetical protein